MTPATLPRRPVALDLHPPRGRSLWFARPCRQCGNPGYYYCHPRRPGKPSGRLCDLCRHRCRKPWVKPAIPRPAVDHVALYRLGRFIQALTIVVGVWPSAALRLIGVKWHAQAWMRVRTGTAPPGRQQAVLVALLLSSPDMVHAAQAADCLADYWIAQEIGE